MIRLYGHMNGSFRTVSLGMQVACEKHGKLDGFVPGEDISTDDGFPGAEARIALTVGAPVRALKPHLRGQHKSHWLLVAPNSNGLDPRLVEQLKGNTYSIGTKAMRPILDGILAPSTWAKGVLESLFPDHPVILWQHGVLPSFRVMEDSRKEVAEDYQRGKFRALHITSTESPRKATRELLRAWKRFCQKHAAQFRSQLDLLVNPAKLLDISNMVQEEQASGVMVAPGQNFSEKIFVHGTSRYHVVVQPSRAEGFGLFPLEARACGVPVIMTDCTGHGDHAEGPGVLIVPTTGAVPSDDYSGSTTPDVSSEDIEAQLSRMVENWVELDRRAREFAPFVQEDWSWESRAAKPLAELEKYA